MVEYTIQIADGLSDVLESETPDTINAEEWLALQAEKAIMQSRQQNKQQELQQKAQQRQNGE